jgi:leucyl-tRNA synthetase
MSKNYHPQEIESNWAKKWVKNPLYQAIDGHKKKKFYAMVEFPYPSGEGLHIGHAFTNTILDVFARKKRAEGLNVLHPMGWDAFGLPTENYAVKTGIHPAKVTKENTSKFRSQMKRLALSYDWDREINTTDSNYYKWTQWIFLQFFKHGLAYKESTPVGWCPSCKIILANEEIVAGNCERCGHEAEHREQKQWLLAITKYADRLDQELDLVDYPNYVKKSQRNWIGRSEGVEEYWQVKGMDLKLATFTTWPHTTWGATFMVIAPEHPIIKELVKGTRFEKGAVAFCQKAIKDKMKDPLNVEKNKEGYFLGRHVINPLSKREMPLYVANFAIFEYGTGIVKCTPTHDQRDFEFAKKYDLDFVPVIYPKGSKPLDPKKMKEAYAGEGLMMNAGQFNDMPTEKARKAVGDYSVKKGHGKWVVNYKLRDWIFSRQRYWGEPFPMVYCKACAKKGISWWDTPEGKKFAKSHLGGGAKTPPFSPEVEGKRLAGWMPLPERSLPLKLPKVKKYEPTDTGESPLAKVTDWVKTKCPHCGKSALRETDTMPNWAGSSWYFLRYCDPDNHSKLAEPKKLKHWMPVDLYLGGAEHTTLHLLYSRFWHKFLNDIGAAPGKEPYAARRQHGVILGEDNQRMSKSRGNIVNPEDVMVKFGADTLRVYLMFMGPYDSTMPWSTKGVEGAYRFLNRIWRLFQEEKHLRGGAKALSASSKVKLKEETSSNLQKKLHQTIKKVTEDIEELKHNTAIAALMEFLNEWSRGKSLSQKDAGVFLQLLAPFAPFLAEELWQSLRSSRIFADKNADKRRPKSALINNRNQRSSASWSVHQQPWPKYNPKLVKEEKVTIVVQVNGKVRGQVEVRSTKSQPKAGSPLAKKVQSEIEKLAKAEANVAKHLKAKKIKKVIFVPGKLLNFVI